MINDNSLNSILIPYDCIVDENAGLLSVIRDYYSNDTVFYMDRIETSEDIENLILYEKYNNPLELILKPEYIDKAEDFYNQFMEEEYDNILTASFITKIYDFVKSINYSKMGYITLLASNKRQEESLKYLFGSDSNIIISPISNVNMTDIDIVFLKRISDFKDINSFKGKNIYLLDYGFNFENRRDEENPLPLIEYSVMIADTFNIINLVTPYIHIEEEESKNDDF